MKAEKIAVRVTNWIGDVVMNVPALELLREHHPDAEIVAIARPWVTDLLRFRSDLIDRCIPFDDRGSDRGLGGFWRFSQQLRGERFSLGFAFTNHLKGALMLYLAGIPVRVGFATAETRLFLNCAIPRKSLPHGTRHQSHNYMDLIARAGFPVTHRPKPQLKVDDAEKQRVREKFLAGHERPCLAVHAGAAYGTAKRWLSDRYASVIKGWLSQHGGHVILLGVASEQEVNDDIAGQVDHPGLVNLCAQTSLAESMTLIAAADGFLSNDSGLMHVAAAFGLPQVAIFGPTDAGATYPDNPDAQVIYKKVSCSPCFKRHCPIGHDCMKAVSEQEVASALERITNRTET